MAIWGKWGAFQAKGRSKCKCLEVKVGFGKESDMIFFSPIIAYILLQTETSLERRSDGTTARRKQN